MNVVTLMGRLTAAPELKTTPNGANVANFSLAVSRDYKDSSGNYPVDFINCVAWRNTADFIAKFFNKGDMIAVSGNIQTRSYNDKNNNKRTAVEVVVEKANFCGGKSSGGGASASQPAGQPNTDSEGFQELQGADDDLPF